MSTETTPTLKLSRATIEVLRWCGRLRPGLFIEAGSRVRSENTPKSTRLEARLAQAFPCSWGIANLKEVLPYLHEGVEVRFESDRCVQLREGRTSLQLVNEPETAVPVPRSETRPPESEESFFLHADDVYELKKLIKHGRRKAGHKKPLGRNSYHPGIVVLDSTNSDGSLRIHYYPDREDLRADHASVVAARRHTLMPSVETVCRSSWWVAISVNNLALAEGSYRVSIEPRGIVRFYWLSDDVSLCIVVEQSLSRVDGVSLYKPATNVSVRPTLLIAASDQKGGC
jgi:hypothetical protein